CRRRNHLDRAAREPKRQRPDRALPRPVKHIVHRRQHIATFKPIINYAHVPYPTAFDFAVVFVPLASGALSASRRVSRGRRFRFSYRRRLAGSLVFAVDSAALLPQLSSRAQSRDLSSLW